MKKRNYLAVAFVAAASLLSSLPASAISVTDFEKLNAQQQTDTYIKIVKDYIAKAYHINKQVGDAVTDYYATTPPGASETKGYTAFDARLDKILHDPNANKDTVQIEGIIGLGIKEDVVDELAKQNSIPAPKSPQAPADPSSSAKPSN